MAKPIVVSFEGEASSFDHRKLDRTKLYGRRVRVALDHEGEPCEKADLAADGSVLIRPGMLAQGYFDAEGRWIQYGDLVGLDPSGEPVDKVSSTLGVEQSLQGPLDPEELLDLSMRAVYMLDPLDLSEGLKAELDAGSIFKFSFVYRTGYNHDDAFLVGNPNGYFAIVGDPAPAAWCELTTLVQESYDDDEPEDDDLDFEMF